MPRDEKGPHPLFGEYTPSDTWHIAVDQSRCRMTVYERQGIYAIVGRQCYRRPRVFCAHGVGYCTKHANAPEACKERNHA